MDKCGRMVSVINKNNVTADTGLKITPSVDIAWAPEAAASRDAEVKVDGGRGRHAIMRPSTNAAHVIHL